MIKVAYVQKDNDDWLNENCYAAAQGFKALGFHVTPVTKNDIDCGMLLGKEDVLHGGIRTVRQGIENLGIPQPEIHHPHLLIRGHSRFTSICPLGHMRKMHKMIADDNLHFTPIFIKPYSVHKLFTGYVVKDPYMGLLKLRHLPDETELLTSEVMDIVTEYRVFVRQGKIVGAKNYAGDYSKVPNFELIQLVVQDYSKIGAPAGYSVDFALTADGKTELIEINDGFGLGTYGLNSITYAKLILARWRELNGLTLNIPELA